MLADVVVVGGGVAGLSVAAGLCRECRVHLIEREPTLAAHASGRNAAIYRPLEDDRTSAALAQRSAELMAAVCELPVLARVGLLLLSAERAQIEAEGLRADAQGVRHRLLDADGLVDVQPCLAGGQARAGILLMDGGVLDIHEILSGLERRVRSSGAKVSLGVGVRRVLSRGGGVLGVQLEDGSHVSTRQVVIAAGAWSAKLASALGLPLPLTPFRRHLIQLTGVPMPSPAHAPPSPVSWRLDGEVYFRREGAGFLASPCDADAWSAGVPPADPHAGEWLADKLLQVAPSLARAGAQVAWACLRTFAPDRELVVGPDPRLAGLHWFAGLGGKGMSVAPAAGELLATTILGASNRLGPSIRTSRLVG